MKLIELWRNLWPDKKEEIELPPEDFSENDDPFTEPVIVEITDAIDLHSIPPKQVQEIVEEYLQQAQARGFAVVRIIHGKGIGVQRELVRTILSRADVVTDFYDAPGNLGATIAELNCSTTNQLFQRK